MVVKANEQVPKQPIGPRREKNRWRGQGYSESSGRQAAVAQALPVATEMC